MFATRLASGASKHARRLAHPNEQNRHIFIQKTVWNVPQLAVCLVYIHMFLELKAPQQNWVRELMCSVDEYNMFAIVWVPYPYQHYCRGSWKIFYLDWCFFSWLRSSLWLQFKPHHIAAGATYLAAKFLNWDLASYQNIWQEFQTTPNILQDVAQQLMELF